jgi:DNA-binding transcriptional ArsR family regulator
VRVEVHDPGVGSVFFALADDTRRHVVERLRDGSSLTPSALACELPVTRQAVTKHLAVLGEAGLVVKTRHGRETHYRLQPERLTEAAAWIASVGGRWDDRLARLDDLLARRRSER